MVFYVFAVIYQIFTKSTPPTLIGRRHTRSRYMSKSSFHILYGKVKLIRLFYVHLSITYNSQHEEKRNINFPWTLVYIKKLAFGFPWENYFTPGFVCSQHTAQLAKTPPSQGTYSHLGRMEPWRYISCAQRNSR